MIVKGQVFDEKMKWLQDANIEVVGENQFAIADEYGEFIVNANSENSQLKFTFIGYDYDIISVKTLNKTGFIELLPKTITLDEVDIYGNKKSKNNIVAIILVLIAILLIAKSSNREPLKVKI